MSGVEILHIVYWPGLWAFSLLAVLVALSSRWLDTRGMARLLTGAAMALIAAFVLRLTTVTALAFYYDLDPYCRYNWWWDFITCGW